MKVRALILDYDGTLIDSASLWLKSVDTVLRELGLNGVDREELARNELKQLIRSRFNENVEESELKTYIYKIWEKFAVMLSSNWLLFKGVKSTLVTLRSKDIPLVLISKRSGKAADVTDEELSKYGLKDMFDQVYTGVSFYDYLNVLVDISESLNISSNEIAVVSDWHIDISRAKSISFKGIGVLTGVSNLMEFKQVNVDLIIENINELPKYV